MNSFIARMNSAVVIVFMCLYACVCVCVYVCLYAYVYVYMCVYVCVSVPSNWPVFRRFGSSGRSRCELLSINI